jgi:outer membrane protein assembly factor BamB
MTWFQLGVLLLALATSLASLAQPSPSGAVLVASPEPGWPQFRGPRRDGISDERGLLQAWPEGGPKQLWTAKGTGRGFSSPIIAEGKIYVTGDFGADLYLVAYDLSGKPLWRTKNGDAWLNQYQGARSSVTYSAGRVYHQNAHGRVVALDAATGQEQWTVNVLERFQGENITWGLSECLIVDDRAVYVTAGGRLAYIVALDKRNGEVLWKTDAVPGATEGAAETAGYAAPILIRFAGRRLVIGCSARNVYCVDVDRGELQWTRPRPTGYSVLAMSPVLVADAVFVTAPLGPPGMLYRLVPPKEPAGKVGVEDDWSTELDSAQGGVVHVEGKLFGAYYPRPSGWGAIDASNGKALYTAPEFTKGAALWADHRLYALSEDGWMRLLQPTATKFEVKGQFRLATTRDRDVWPHPVIHEGRMYLRYHDTLYCYDIRAGSAVVSAFPAP